MYCSKCGAELSAEAKFCKNCGTKIKSETRPEENNVPTVDNQQGLECTQADNSNVWYYMSGNQQVGPLHLRGIIRIIQSGAIRRTTLVWTNGMATWVNAAESELAQYFQNIIPDVPVTVVSDKWLWAMATVPLLVSTILLREILLHTENADLYNTIVTIILNCAFLYLDVAELEKAKINIGKSVWLGLVLIPVYLYVRANKTTKNYAPCVTWVVLFIVCLFL